MFTIRESFTIDNTNKETVIKHSRNFRLTAVVITWQATGRGTYRVSSISYLNLTDFFYYENKTSRNWAKTYTWKIGFPRRHKQKLLFQWPYIFWDSYPWKYFSIRETNLSSPIKGRSFETCDCVVGEYRFRVLFNIRQTIVSLGRTVFMCV